MSPALPPPFGNSTSFMDRNSLEGITFVSLIIGVPAVVVAVGMAIMLWYCCYKKLAKEKSSSTHCTEAVGYSCALVVMLIVGIFVIIFTVPLWVAVMIAIVVIIVIGAVLGLLIGVLGLLIGVVCCFTPLCTDKVLCHKAGSLRDPNSMEMQPTGASLPGSNEAGPLPESNTDEASAACKLWDKISEPWDKISAAIITLFFSSVNERLDAGKDSLDAGKDVVELVIAKRKEPKCGIRKHAVRLYFVTVAALALLWFLLLLVDDLWYRKVTSCNDININNDNHVCYLIDNHGKLNNSEDPVTCTGRNDPRNILCYIYTFSPFMALGIAGSVTRSTIFMADVAINVALKLGEEEYGCAILVVVQTLVVCVSVVFSIVIPVSHVAIGTSLVGWFFQGQTGIRVFIFILAAITIAVLPMVPWWAFQGKRFVDTSKEDPESQGAYLSLDETESNEKYKITWGLEVYTRKAK